MSAKPLAACLTLAVAFAWLPLHAGAAEWGSLKGRFVVDGEAPDPPPLVVDKDAFCMKIKPQNNALVVADDGSLANAVVYLRLERGAKVDIHPDYDAQLDEPAEIDNHECTFEPHIVLVRVGQTLVIKNSDPPPTGHNTNIAFLRYNQTIPAESETQIKIGKDSAVPQPVVCNIHPWMKAHLLPQPHPYMAASGEDGTFEIKNVPVGKREFQFWHEAQGFMKDLPTEGGKTDGRGRLTVNIEAGETLDLGEIKVPPAMLKAR